MTVAYANEAESYVLGCALWSAASASTVVRSLTPTDFRDPRHRSVLAAVNGLLEEGKGVSPILVLDWLRRDGEPGAVDALFISGLMSDAGSALHLPEHIALVKNRSNVAKLRSLTAVDIDSLSDDQIREMAQRNDELLHSLVVPLDRTQAHVRDSVRAHLEAIEQRERNAVATSLVDLDNAITGFRPGQLVLVAGRPGSGKSALMLWAALQAGLAGKRVAVFSLEMSAAEIQDRLLSSLSTVPLSTITKRDLDEGEWTKLVEASARLQGAEIILHDEEQMTVGKMWAECRRLVAQYGGLDMVVVDYVQLLETGKGRQRWEEVGAMTRQLKIMARSLGVPVLVGSQLNRNLEERKDKRPQLGDLRESGSLEQDADVVLMLYRPVMYDQKAKTEEAEIIVAKQRQGESGVIIRCRFDPERMTYKPRSKYLFGTD